MALLWLLVVVSLSPGRSCFSGCFPGWYWKVLRVVAPLGHRIRIRCGPYSRHSKCCVCCDWPAVLLSVFAGVAAVDKPHLCIVWPGFICLGLRHYAVGYLTPLIRLILWDLGSSHGEMRLVQVWIVAFAVSCGFSHIEGCPETCQRHSHENWRTFQADTEGECVLNTGQGFPAYTRRQAHIQRRLKCRSFRNVSTWNSTMKG